jgi:putative tryptophan/tyrosine transport system substrate-binding protein
VIIANGNSAAISLFGLRRQPQSPRRHRFGFGPPSSYGPDTLDIIRRSTSYVVRVLRGGRPSELPVQAPAKYELLINLKTAKALGLKVSTALRVRASEVIE